MKTDANAPGQDSFLDVVTNIVGILIILMIVAGLRVKNAPLKEAEKEAICAATVGLQTDLAIESSLRDDVRKAAEQIRRLQREVNERHQERSALAARVAFLERQIESAREQSDAGSQQCFELQQALVAAQQELARLEQERMAAKPARAEPVLVESYPTPLGKTVDENEVHFQLRAGRIAHIPLDKLIGRLKSDFQQKAYRLLDLPELTDTVGPEGGFRLRYVLQRRDLPIETQMATGRGIHIELRQWTLIPVSGQLGEPVETALAKGSQFRQALSQHVPQRTTITIWTYPDSFAEFRRLKKELFHMGFATAGRPLPEGVPIGGSPEGTKSLAQ